MIQRIQSLYLLLITVLSVIVVFSPVAEMSKAGYLLDLKEMNSIVKLTIIVLSAIIPIISLIALFLFKKRLLQIRLCIINIVLIIGYYSVLLISTYMAVEIGFDYNLRLSVIFPLISAILCYLAVRAIRKDEALIKSLNRMR